jgi:hypothetical protein
MEANEMRYGQYYFGEKGEIECFDMSLYHVDTFDHWKPIPLTEEWLIKLGFGMESPGFYSYGEESMADYCYNLDDKTFHEYYPTSDMNCLAKCEYVHQLQNLFFALTGEELTIK